MPPLIPHLDSLLENIETLNLLGKYNAYYISQNRWDQVLLCVEEALPLAPNDTHWLNIKQEALIRIGHKEVLPATQVDTKQSEPKKDHKSENIKVQPSNKGAS